MNGSIPPPSPSPQRPQSFKIQDIGEFEVEKAGNSTTAILKKVDGQKVCYVKITWDEPINQAEMENYIGQTLGKDKVERLVNQYGAIRESEFGKYHRDLKLVSQGNKTEIAYSSKKKDELGHNIEKKSDISTKEATETVFQRKIVQYETKAGRVANTERERDKKIAGYKKKADDIRALIAKLYPVASTRSSQQPSPSADRTATSAPKPAPSRSMKQLQESYIEAITKRGGKRPDRLQAFYEQSARSGTPISDTDQKKLNKQYYSLMLETDRNRLFEKLDDMSLEADEIFAEKATEFMEDVSVALFENRPAIEEHGTVSTANLPLDKKKWMEDGLENVLKDVRTPIRKGTPLFQEIRKAYLEAASGEQLAKSLISLSRSHPIELSIDTDVWEALARLYLDEAKEFGERTKGIHVPPEQPPPARPTAASVAASQSKAPSPAVLHHQMEQRKTDALKAFEEVMSKVGQKPPKTFFVQSLENPGSNVSPSARYEILALYYNAIVTKDKNEFLRTMGELDNRLATSYPKPPQARIDAANDIMAYRIRLMGPRLKEKTLPANAVSFDIFKNRMNEIPQGMRPQISGPLMEEIFSVFSKGGTLEEVQIAVYQLLRKHSEPNLQNNPSVRYQLYDLFAEYGQTNVVKPESERPRAVVVESQPQVKATTPATSPPREMPTNLAGRQQAVPSPPVISIDQPPAALARAASEKRAPAPPPSRGTEPNLAAKREGAPPLFSQPPPSPPPSVKPAAASHSAPRIEVGPTLTSSPAGNVDKAREFENAFSDIASNKKLGMTTVVQNKFIQDVNSSLVLSNPQKNEMKAIYYEVIMAKNRDEASAKLTKLKDLIETYVPEESRQRVFQNCFSDIIRNRYAYLFNHIASFKMKKNKTITRDQFITNFEKFYSSSDDFSTNKEHINRLFNAYNKATTQEQLANLLRDETFTYDVLLRLMEQFVEDSSSSNDKLPSVIPITIGEQGA